MRDQLVMLLQSRIRRYEQSRVTPESDPGVITHPEALEAARRLAAILSDDDVEAAYVVGMVHLYRAEILGSHADVQVAVGFLRLVYRVDQDRVPERVAVLIEGEDTAIAGTQGRASMDGDAAELRAKISELRREYFAAPAGGLRQLGLTLALATLLRELFERPDGGGREHLDEAARLAQWAEERTRPLGRPSLLRRLTGRARFDTVARVSVLLTLAGIMSRHYEQTGEDGDFERALSACDEAATILSGQDSPRLALLRAGVNLERGSAWAIRYQSTLDTQALARAVSPLRTAVTLIPADDPQRWVGRANLAGILIKLYAATGDQTAYDEGIGIYRELVAGEGAPREDTLTGALGAALLTHYGLTRELATLREAVDVLRLVRANSSTAFGRSHQSTLGLALMNLHQRGLDQGNDDTTLLEDAVTCCRTALQGADPTEAQYPGLVMQLAVVLGHRYECRGERADLAECVTLLDRLIALPSWADRGDLLGMAGVAHVEYFDATGESSALERGVTLLRRAATLDPGPSRAESLAGLCAALRRLADQIGRPELLTEAVAAGSEGAGLTVAPASVRLQAASGWLAAALAAGDTAHAHDAAQAVAALLPATATRRSGWTDRFYHLAYSTGIASDVVAAELSRGRPDVALELAEAVRGMLLADAIDARGDLAALEQTEPDLAAQVEQVRDRLRALDDDTDVRARLTDELDALLVRVRQRPGFSTFLTAPTFAELRAQAGAGAIVVVNANRHRCDAIVLTPAGEIQTVGLPALTVADANQHADALAALADPRRRAAAIAAGADATATLAWIWSTITLPVLTALGHTTPAPATGEWPRIWWCPIGVTTRLPLHAPALDYVISSYTPTIRALAHARRTPTTADLRSLVVSVPDAPGNPRLPCVATEAATIAEMIPGSTILAGPAATTARVLAELPGHGLIHFGCHAYSSASDPAYGSLVLHDHAQEPLTVAALSRLRLPRAELAYLSACRTTGTSATLLDESVHLTGACQLAGFPTVIGTLWTVDDAAAQRIATDFYTNLTTNGTRTPATDHAARALHLAARQERQRHPDEPLRWSAHVHVGR